MKKTLLTYCLMLPLIGLSQNVKTLKHQADSLRKISKYKEAEPLYAEAITRVTGFEEKVTNHQWVGLCLAAQQNHIKAYTYTDDKTALFVNWEYGQNGPKLKENIQELIRQKSALVFTYESFSGSHGNIYMIRDSISHKEIGVSAYRRFLFWGTADNTYFIQAFSEANVYEPLRIRNKAFINFVKLHADEIPLQSVTRPHLKNVENVGYVFRFYTSDNVWVKELYDPNNTSTRNSNTAVYKLLPLVKDLITAYDFEKL